MAPLSPGFSAWASRAGLEKGGETGLMAPLQLNPQKPYCPRDEIKCQPQAQDHNPLTIYSSPLLAASPPGSQALTLLCSSHIGLEIPEEKKFPHPPAISPWQKCSELRSQGPELGVPQGLQRGLRLCWDYSFIWSESSCQELPLLLSCEDTKKDQHRVCP